MVVYDDDNLSLEKINQWADFWYYEIGINVIPANTKEKITYEAWLPWQDQPIPEELHKFRKENGEYGKGIAVVLGKIWRGPYQGQYLNGIDCDNKKAIKEICNYRGKTISLQQLADWTIVEQHTDEPKRMHIYIRSKKPFRKKSTNNTNPELLKKINANDIPAFEVKGLGQHGIFFCTPSIHQNGYPYQIIGTKEPVLCDEFENHLDNICKSYGIQYLDDYSNDDPTYSDKIPIKNLFQPDFVILEGNNRHEGLLRAMESLLKRNQGILDLEQIKQFAQIWNQKHCEPPLDNKEFEKQWECATKFVSQHINSNTMSYNGNGHYSNNNQDKLNIQSRKIVEFQSNNYFEYVVKSIKKTVKCEDALIRQVLYTGLSTYVEDDPINLGILAPTSEGKTYAITESLQYFPDDDVVYIGQMSPKVLVRQKGNLIDKKSGQPLEVKVQELRTKSRELAKKKRNTKDKDQIADINEEIEKINEDIRKLFDNSKTLIDLRGKILVFLEPPKHELWELLKPILSHDKKEIEFPFVDKTSHSNAETKDVVVRGFPACIFCSAKDESKWEIWNEIKSRILVTSPNMVPKKYEESNKLISQSKGLPNLIQQQIIISDDDIEKTKNCILLIKQKINELKSKNNKNGKISLWIPYYDLLQRELPANKGTDVRFAKKVFSLLNIVPIVKSALRMVLMMEGESSIIANLEDLREVLSITQNFDGLPKFKAEFFRDIFSPCFARKTKPDSNKDGKKEEEIIAITTRELCAFYKEIKRQPITTDNLKHTYINQLINEGIIDYTGSKIDSRQNIYYPLVTESISIMSITSPIDNLSQQTPTPFEIIIKNITQGWIFHEIIHLIRYRLCQGEMELINYINDPDKFQILEDASCMLEKEDKEKPQGSKLRLLSVDDFIKKYVDISSTSIDIYSSPLLTDFAKRSQIMSSLAKIDSKDMKKSEAVEAN